ncbi:MAG: branched-chain-amino-acid transaminase [Pelobium sp.]
MEHLSHQKNIYIDGKIIPSSSSGVNAASQTLNYGFGAFEGIRSYATANGTKIFKAEEHFKRLKSSCEQIHLPFKWDIKQLIKDTHKLLEANGLNNAYIKPVVYSGEGMNMVNSDQSHILIMAWEWESFFGDRLLKTCISSYEKPNPNSAPINAKLTGNYLNSVLAISEANRNGFDEAILIDMHGYLTESSSANIFIEKDGKLFTPCEGNILLGITRKTVMQIAKQLDIEVLEKNLTINDLKNADAAFLCGTAAEIVGIQSIDETHLPFSFSDSIGSSIQRVYKSLVLDKLSFEVII